MTRKRVRLIGVLVAAGLALCIGAVATQQVIQSEQEVTIDEVPAAVKATILAEADGAAIQEIEVETEDGQTVYEAEVLIDGQEVDIVVAPDGTLLGKEAEDEEDEADDDDEEEEEEDEEEVTVTLDAVPEAVRATIEQEAAGGQIEEVEMETEDGQVVYEAEVTIDGQEVDIEVAADGTLLGKEVDEDDDDEDEDTDDDDK